MNALERSTRKKREWTCWSGTIPQLTLIGNAMAAACEVRRSALLATFDRETSDVLENMSNDITRAVESAARNRQRERILESLQVELTIVDGDDSVSGPFAAVLNELDRRSIKTVRFEASSHIYGNGDMVSVVFTRPEHAWGSGVSLEVRSSDQGWGRQIFVSLTDEIEKGVPRWSLFHTLRGHQLLYQPAYCSLLFLCIMGLWPEIHIKHHIVQAIIFFSSLSAICIIPAFYVTQYKIRAWVFPQFEVLAEGSDSSGSRRLAYIGAILLSVPIGILVNMVS